MRERLRARVRRTAIHLEVAYIVPVNRQLQVVVFGGPSFFTVKQSVVTAITFDEDYPFDEATFTSADVDTEEEQKTGFNVGADVGYYFTKNVGVGGIVRFSQTKVTFSLGEVDAGGAMVGGGLRLRFYLRRRAFRDRRSSPPVELHCVLSRSTRPIPRVRICGTSDHSLRTPC